MSKDWRWLLSFWLAFLIAIYVHVRLNRYELHRDGVNFIFDKWTTRVDRAQMTPVHFVSDPAPKQIP